MSSLPTNHKCRRHAAAACAGLVLIAAGVSLSACSEAPSSSYSSETASHYEPAKLEPIKGTEVKRVIFSAEGAKRVGLQTAAIRQNGQRKIIPYAAIIYDSKGNTYTYTSPERLTFVRQEVEIDRVDGDRVVLSDGPPAGTEVVTVGAAEVYGTEFEVAH
jgi:CRISPR/Cas system CSM-associated protein Csm3 (group 7 of RAMP superfamily)